MEAELLAFRQKGFFMSARAEPLEGIQLGNLTEGTVLDLETKSRHYRVEYLGGSVVRISGHPLWCPTPTVATLHGSTDRTGTLEVGFIGRGMRLVFRRLEDGAMVTTSEIADIRPCD